MLKKKLIAYIDNSGLTKAEFAKLGGITSSDLSRVLGDTRKTISPRVALGIEKATKGEIAMREWFEAAA